MSLLSLKSIQMILLEQHCSMQVACEIYASAVLFIHAIHYMSILKLNKMKATSISGRDLEEFDMK